MWGDDQTTPKETQHQICCFARCLRHHSWGCWIRVAGGHSTDNLQDEGSMALSTRKISGSGVAHVWIKTELLDASHVRAFRWREEKNKTIYP